MVGVANSINESTTGITGFDGTAFVGTALTQYFVNCGGATSSTISQVAATGNSGQVLTSQGAGSLPHWADTSVTSFPWTDKAADYNALASNGYFVTALANGTLPAAPNQGDTIIFMNAGAGASNMVITANAGQTIFVGNASSTVAGTATSNASGDSFTLVYQAAATAWYAYAVQGTFTLA